MDDAAHSELAYLVSISNQNISMKMPTAKFDKGNYSADTFSPCDPVMQTLYVCTRGDQR